MIGPRSVSADVDAAHSPNARARAGPLNAALMIGWTIVGLGIYFGYGYKHSKVRIASQNAPLHVPAP